MHYLLFLDKLIIETTSEAREQSKTVSKFEMSCTTN